MREKQYGGYQETIIEPRPKAAKETDGSMCLIRGRIPRNRSLGGQVFIHE